MIRRAFAPAKVNLYLHVGPLGADGYHPVESWMAFADLGDWVSLEQGAAYGLQVTGPYAAGLSAGPDNLVLRARDAAMKNTKAKIARFGMGLEKNLPLASGLGGGSSDAGASLRLLADYLGLSDDRLVAIAMDLGADVPACLKARATIARGRGERLSPAPEAPPLDAVLVNPGIETLTGTVFAEFDRTARPGVLDANLPPGLTSARQVAAMLGKLRNDLEGPAASLHPEIRTALTALEQAPESLVARMSGSGATCFALCDGPREARRLADRVANERPDWWVRTCRLS